MPSMGIFDAGVTIQAVSFGDTFEVQYIDPDKVTREVMKGEALFVVDQRRYTTEIEDVAIMLRRIIGDADVSTSRDVATLILQSVAFRDRLEITFIDPANASPAATLVETLMIDPAPHGELVGMINSDLQDLVEQIEVDRRNPPDEARA